MSIGLPKPQYAEAKRKAKRQRQKAFTAAWQLVWDRDKGRCRACGFRVQQGLIGSGLASEGNVHHIVKRSQSKALREATSNMVLLDAKCHHDAHAGALKIEGNADERLTFTRKP